MCKERWLQKKKDDLADISVFFLLYDLQDVDDTGDNSLTSLDSDPDKKQRQVDVGTTR